MSHYRKIDTRIWNDAKFSAMTDDGKIAFLFLLTHPSLTPFGAMRATMDGLGAELGWQPKRFEEGLREGLQEGYVEANRKACYIGAKNFIKYNGPDNINMLKGMEKFIDLLPECDERAAMFRRTIEFIVNEKQSFNGQAEPFIKRLLKAIPEGLPEGLPEGYANGYANSQSTEHRAQSTEAIHLRPAGGESDEIHLEDEAPKAPKPKAAAPDDDFHDWWCKIREFDGILAKRSVKSMSHRCWVALRKEFAADEIIEWWHGVLDGMRDPEYWPGFQVRAKLENLRDWKEMRDGEDAPPSQEEIEKRERTKKKVAAIIEARRAAFFGQSKAPEAAQA